MTSDPAPAAANCCCCNLPDPRAGGSGGRGSPRGWEWWDRDEEEKEEGRLLLAALGMGLEQGRMLEKIYSGSIIMKINLTRLIFSPADDAGTI